MVQTAVDGILTIDEGGAIVTVNPAAERIFDYPAAEMIGRNIRMLMAEPYQSEHNSYIGNYLRTGERKIIGIGREVQGRRKDGSNFPLDLAVSETRVGGERIFTGIVRDISERKQSEELLRRAKDELVKTNEDLERRVEERTADLAHANAALRKTLEEQKRLEDQLRQSQKMESIGTLAGGIAHDFNNILNIIRGYTTLIGPQLSADRQVQDGLRVIDREIDRGATVVRQLMTVARKSETRLERADINQVVSTLSQLIKIFPKTITVELDLDRGLAPVRADTNKLDQALLNICVNARDAMPAGGKLTIKTKMIDANKLPNGGGDGSDSYACIAISDTGSGMPEEVRQRIFEPFFTTKGVGQGTGLGLAIAYGIVKEHNGFIDVESRLGQGTTFRLYLPTLARDEQSTVAAAVKGEITARKQSNGRGTVLVVEDEETLVSLLKRLLPQAGYRVLAALDGEQAIDLYRDCHAEIDIVLLDLGLPKITGVEVMASLQEKNPGVNIIVTTGYLDADLKAQLVRSGVKDCIHKPYLIADIITKIGAILEHC
ncbi:MAG TPA: PAS domain S-box protein [Candidatus Binatus sp.]|nr:PAS domain S-box protein [Candidatus Binatus sp.]